MKHQNFHHHTLFDRVFPVVFTVIFVIALAVILFQFALLGWAGYHVLTDPEGTANMVGTIVGEAVRPVADAIKGE